MKTSIILSLGDEGETVMSHRDLYSGALLGREAGAVFDMTRKYRYLLWRTWSGKRAPICFVMLNPSTADAFRLDPTITRCYKFAQKWGYGGLRIVNLFAFRSTDPQALKRRRDPVGPLNDDFIERAIADCDKTILAWGNHGMLHERHLKIMQDHSSRTLHHLGLTLKGQPKHPLYVSGETKTLLMRW